MKEKKVLLILQVYNEIANIEQCVESIKSQNINFLCLISDNISNDGTREFLTTFVSRNPSDFILISPKTHLNIATHFSFICGYHDASFDVIPVNNKIQRELPPNFDLMHVCQNLTLFRKLKLSSWVLIQASQFQLTNQ